MLEETYFPSKYSYLSGENLTGSIYEALRKHGTVMAHAVKTIGICYATNAEAEYLHVSRPGRRCCSTRSRFSTRRAS